MHILQGGRAAIHLISAAVILVLGYWWLVYSLEQFPYTVLLGEKLGASLGQLFFDLGRGALVVIPGLVAVVIIILIARWCARLINTVLAIESGGFSCRVAKRTVRTTQPADRRRLIFASGVAIVYTRLRHTSIWARHSSDS
jgi:hypothetical protein